jgi:hypothetical protein
MKLFTLLSLFFISGNSFAQDVELGKYLAVPKDYPSASALIDLKIDGSATAKITGEDLEVNCAGSFNVEDRIVNSHVNCDHPDVTEIKVIIDMTPVTPENIRSEKGVEVMAKFDLIGDDPIPFILKKAD